MRPKHLFKAAAIALLAASSAHAAPAAPQITAPVDDSDQVQLDYDAPISIHVVHDAGALRDSQAMEHLQLVLKRPVERQAALDKLVAEQLNAASANFRQWVKPAAFGETFGPAESDIQATIRWLEAHKFTVNSVSPNRMSIDFSGTVGHVSEAFGTEIHEVVTVDGAHHMANLSAPAIPAALSGVVHGVTLSNFFPKPTVHEAGAVSLNRQTGHSTITKPAPGFTVPFGKGFFFAVTPSDFDTIYNLGPLLTGNSGFPTPITGAGVTLIVAEQTDIKRQDWNSFRSAFGLSGYKGTLKFLHPGACSDPGYTADEGEAALDAEWSSAVAPDATIVEASCGPTSPFNFGVMNTLSNLVNGSPVGSVISISYGGCEVQNGLSFQAMWTGLVEQAASEGISVFVSAGDSAAAGCDNPGSPAAKFGLGVNGLASSPYDTVAGGTDFSDTADGTDSLYWSAANSSTLGSALSYIPEIPWDNSCASSVLWKFYGAKNGIAFCNSSVAAADSQAIVGGSGGRSQYYAKPDWQSVGLKGMPNDGARDLPDVSLFAANGIWAHFYIYCMSDTKEGGTPCNYNNPNDVLGSAAGGTSFVAPILAGVQALIVQVKGEAVGNAAPRYYQLAQLQYDQALLLNTCKSNLGANISTACVFNEITRGNIAVPCKKGTPNCFTDAQSTAGIGILSTSRTKEIDAYPATLGWNFATGLGSINITNLLYSY